MGAGVRTGLAANRIARFRLGRVASYSVVKHGTPERADEAGSIPDHVERFLRGGTAGAASPPNGEDVV